MAHPHRATLESIKYSRTSFTLLDQRQLPFATVFDDVRTVQDVWVAIKEMRVRGAPAIAVSAALGIATAGRLKLEANEPEVQSVDGAKAFLLGSLDYVATSRPTAVNLFNAVSFMKNKVQEVAPTADTGAALIWKFVELAEEMYNEDVSFNERIMKHGAAHILAKRAATNADKKVNILTICNTGALATSRYGTALGVVRELFYGGNLEQLYACETRPWNQGARLTVYECVEENIPCTLICDSAAASLMKSKRIDAVIVGADRVCNNGDTANKIGTYHLAVAAKHHGVPFYVAAPSTTLDPNTATGDSVTIEEREPLEITHNLQTKQRVVAEGEHLSIWNPVFDITPGEIITGGIITEDGVVEPKAAAPFFDFGGAK
ncbi:methylthioribose-1-phosphate isomerase, putative [Bodo saltans]|uniref:Methylthioribose-1-phosphate isomerase n=1 Tax=Bodo saltans TaxID=75058 RepID=A0A0S4JDE3_BODSA|nr:methylthioribose-1-phosphate isomerase, putative [Bodo saltans]|eukprot:CUG89402.1 methylthioribose-1-phosphate isomerase, putative [Bodo saltans]